jgi:hypothetical protein
VEVKDRDFEYGGFGYDIDRGFHKSEMERVMRIWFKIKYNHEIEDATAGIEWEIEQEAVNREEQEAEQEARRAAWRAAQANEVRLPRRWQTPSLVEIPPASMLPKPPTQPIIRRR